MAHALLSIDWVFVDPWMVIVNKRPKLLTIPGKDPNVPNLCTLVQAHFPSARAVHRLDQATSGLVLFARNKTIHSKLSHLFETRQVNKTYIAEVEGYLSRHTGTICAPILLDFLRRPKHIVHPQGRTAITHWQVIRMAQNKTRLLLSPETGRTHQLRVHAAYLKHPMLGDTLYGTKSAARLHLHAYRLSFKHPISHSLLTFESPPSF